MSVIIKLPLRGVWVPLANINITDTYTHTYLTDPPNASGNGIDIIYLGEKIGSGNNPIKAFALWVFNNENQKLTVQPITNVVDNGMLPDTLIGGTQTTVPAGGTVIESFNFAQYPMEFFSVYLSFSTAPTGPPPLISATNTRTLSPTPVLPQGVYAVLYLYYG
ncbi:MAG: hypothetical protein ACPLVI_06120 [Thermoplasmata archaeon]